MNDIQAILKKYWGYNSFRAMQEEIIQSVLDGKDTLAILPTGGGKSICFQVPAMVKEGICLVVSPLIALMKDQVENLHNNGIPALSIYSGMSFTEVRKTLENAAYGNFKFLYVSPERLETSLFIEYLPALNISFLVVDEAHCISQWGYDFRPPYLRIAALREYLPGITILALTASATKNIQEDICEKLLFKNDYRHFQKSFERPNLSYSVFKVTSRQNKLVEILQNVPGTAIVYCRSRRQTKEVTDLLRMNKINAEYYHAGLMVGERNTRQENWLSGKTRVIVSTNAFGMGIDKANVRAVVHFEVPDCLENYYQEAGRAGRDEKRAYAVLLYSDNELADLHQQIQVRFPPEKEIKKGYIALMNHLQVAAGSGEGLSYDFDIAVFAKAFKLELLPFTYIIKVLEQEGLISFNEVFFKPSTVVFIIGKDVLNDFEKNHPELEPLIKGLLRMYEGIFDSPVIIYESQVAVFMKEHLTGVKRQLQALHVHKVISYSAQKETPQINLLRNRMYGDSFKIDGLIYKTRKINYEKRVGAIVNYIKNEIDCRSSLVAGYFGDNKVKPCGICDNCINTRIMPVTKEEFESISQNIFHLITENPLTFKHLHHKMKDVDKEKLWTVIDYLQAENKVMVNRLGELTC